MDASGEDVMHDSRSNRSTNYYVQFFHAKKRFFLSKKIYLLAWKHIKTPNRIKLIRKISVTNISVLICRKTVALLSEWLVMLIGLYYTN